MTSTGLVPLIRYRDVAAAVDWLTATFGFEKRSIIHDPDGSIAYAELSYGHGIVMLGPVGQSVLDTLLKQPDEMGGIGTQSCYVAVADVESHFKHARAAGAEIVLEFGSDEAGDRAYAARDPEGHIWNFGAYSPWPALTAPESRQVGAQAMPVRGPSRAQAALGGSVAVLALATVAGLAFLEPLPFAPSGVGDRTLGTPPAGLAAAPSDDLKREAASLRETLEREAHARQEAARGAAAIREQLTRERAAREVAETEATALRAQITREREARLETVKRGEPKPAATPAAPPAAPPTATATAPEVPGVPPATTGSLGAQPREPTTLPTAAEPAPSVTVQPPPPAATVAPAKPAAAKTVKPTTTRQTRAPAPKKARPKREGGDDPFFLYD